MSSENVTFEALHELGVAAQMRGEHVKAEEYFRQALALNPDYAFARLALAQLQMMQSLFQEGRQEYEARFEAVTEASGPDWRGLPYPRWQGESLAGKKLYLWAEQGLGDIVMFAGFLPHLLAQKPARIVLGMFPKLIPLFKRSFPHIDIEPIDDAGNHALMPTMLTSFPQIEKLAEIAAVPFSLEPLRASYDYGTRHGLFDMAAPLGDVLVHCLPGFIPAQHQGAYLTADSGRVKEIKAQLNAVRQGKLVGISWHTDNKREVVRNVPLEEWVRLLKTQGCHFVSLQHRVSAEEIEGFCKANGCAITVDAGIDLVQDAEGLVALIAAMDEVITIDNSNAHIAGALGVNTKLLLPKGHNYRWPVLPDEGTLWYKSVKAFRQEVAESWEDVMKKMVY